MSGQSVANQVALFAALFAALACSSTPPGEPSACAADAGGGFEFTRVRLDTEFSHPDCPRVEPAELNGALVDGGAAGCMIEPDGCAIDVECDFGFAAGGGQLRRRDGRFEGSLRVERPVDCIYDVAVVGR